MAWRRAKGMGRKFNRKGQKKARMLRPLAAKKYTYDFNLLPQILRVDPTTGLASISPATAAGQVPLTNAATQIQQYSSGTAFTNVADVALSSTFRLSDVANSANYQILYDAYKINSITMSIEYLSNGASVGNVGFMPKVYIYNDQDDATVPPSLQSMMGKQGLKQFQFGNNSRTKFSYKWRPTNTVGLAAFSGSGGVVTLNAGIAKSGWINCANIGLNVEHYALKMFIADLSTVSLNTSAVNAFRISWKYNVSFRSPIQAS